MKQPQNSLPERGSLRPTPEELAEIRRAMTHVGFSADFYSCANGCPGILAINKQLKDKDPFGGRCDKCGGQLIPIDPTGKCDPK